ncbi:class I SAM-dependent methyltransferase [Halorubrum tebenquichense]|uniref:class I SAM-dependent methyltransferase n=1 Tax=Halorubrum tebenquichense TaxID=119434 RepID=UPI000677A8F4|nr:class I SAM-dependent methyltransferase [Halorubrum tebenquichense]
MARFQNTGQPDWDWWSRLWPTPGATLRKLGVESGESVAEVGCGSGYFALPAARIAESESVYAVDVDASLLDELDGRADRQGIDNVVPVHGDARNLTDVLPDSVSTLVVANTFHGVGDQSGLVEQAFRAIEPGGSLIIVNWHDRPRETTTVGTEPRGPPTALRTPPGETEDVVLSAAPFTLDRLVELPPYHYGLVFDR